MIFTLIWQYSVLLIISGNSNNSNRSHSNSNNKVRIQETSTPKTVLFFTKANFRLSPDCTNNFFLYNRRNRFLLVFFLIGKLLSLLWCFYNCLLFLQTFSLVAYQFKWFEYIYLEIRRFLWKFCALFFQNLVLLPENFPHKQNLYVFLKSVLLISIWLFNNSLQALIQLILIHLYYSKRVRQKFYLKINKSLVNFLIFTVVCTYQFQ